ncbi:MAG: hypothetical protein HY014_02790 [Acidobacteria bacterium]|nr:hypothetical protein [Acidobacteriota bacterium]MBI3487077.1 hypothetical protein [Acidobacteriota bacterium]
MPFRRWFAALLSCLASGQETPFAQEPVNPWQPAWELTLRGDQLSDPGEPSERFQRAGLQWRLRWAWEGEGLRFVAGTRSAMGSDGNRFNGPRWDQQPSNGSQLDLAQGEAFWASERAFGDLRLGFQENGLLSSQAIWDQDLRLLGLGARAGFRSPQGVLQEASLRGVAGRVREVLGGKADLAAGQLVLKIDAGPWSWTAHAGRWQLSWEPGEERLRRLPGHDPASRQVLALDEAGAAVKWHGRLPVEIRWSGAKNRESGETSEEAQLLAGGRERLYWPQLALTWQRLSSTGTLYPVNGDEWWYYRRARGPRLELAMPLPGNWIATFSILRQRFDGESQQVVRRMLVLKKRF